MKYDEATLRSWITKIQDEGRGTTTWEDEFVESVNTQLAERGRLSDSQVAVLERIYSERTPL